MADPFQIDETDLVAGARRAAGWVPLQRSVMAEVYTGYGVKAGGKKGLSDTQLFEKATNDVISWWKRQHAEPTGSGSAPGGSAPGGRPVFSGGSGGGYAGPMMSDTSVATGPTGGPSGAAPLPNIIPPGSKVGTAMPKLTPDSISATLNKAGLGNAKPPAYATVSAAALDGWITRAYRQMGQERPDRKPSSSTVAARLAAAGLAGARPPSYALATLADFTAWIARAVRQRDEARQSNTTPTVNRAAPSSTGGGYVYVRPATSTGGFREF